MYTFLSNCKYTNNNKVVAVVVWTEIGCEVGFDNVAQQKPRVLIGWSAIHQVELFTK